VSLFLLDTDHLTLYQMGHPRVIQNVVAHAAAAPAITVITVEEQLTGWQRALRQAKDDSRREQIYRRMALTVENMSSWRIFPYASSAMGRHTGFLRQRLNVGSNDLKIAAIALDNNATVATRNS
jgi:tRNA(fMet)-specific endonuclease VapC